MAVVWSIFGTLQLNVFYRGCYILCRRYLLIVLVKRLFWSFDHLQNYLFTTHVLTHYISATRVSPSSTTAKDCKNSFFKVSFKVLQSVFNSQKVNKGGEDKQFQLKKPCKLHLCPLARIYLERLFLFAEEKGRPISWG